MIVYSSSGSNSSNGLQFDLAAKETRDVRFTLDSSSSSSGIISISDESKNGGSETEASGSSSENKSGAGCRSEVISINSSSEGSSSSGKMETVSLSSGSATSSSSETGVKNIVVKKVYRVSSSPVCWHLVFKRAPFELENFFLFFHFYFNFTPSSEIYDSTDGFDDSVE